MRRITHSVSPNNPWYFDIDGVVFSKETGLLVLFPPGNQAVQSTTSRAVTSFNEKPFLFPARQSPVPLDVILELQQRSAVRAARIFLALYRKGRFSVLHLIT